MKLPHAAWVVVADGRKYLLLENQGESDMIDLRVRRAEETELASTRESGTDRPGRYPGPGPRRVAVEQTDWKAQEKERFAAELADRLDRLAPRIPGFVLVADAHSLGILRAELGERARSRMIGEIEGDFTNHTIDRIEDAIRAA